MAIIKTRQVLYLISVTDKMNKLKNIFYIMEKSHLLLIGKMGYFILVSFLIE